MSQFTTTSMSDDSSLINITSLSAEEGLEDSSSTGVTSTTG